jgi:SAM-dependent methyltransferase
MMTTPTKAAIARDFAQKRGSYFQGNYGTETPQNHVRRLRRRLILDAVGEKARGGSVLDAGCGPAILYPEVLEQCSSYVALDLAPANLEEIATANRNPKVQCVQSDLDDFAWPKEDFDVIICGGAIEYTSDAEHVLLKMMGALRTGGFLVCSFPNALSPYRVWGEYFYTPLSQLRRRLLRRRVNSYPRRLFFPYKVRALLAHQVGEHVVRYFGQKLLLQPLDTVFPRLDQSLNTAFERHPVRGIENFASEFLVIARK